MSFQSFDRIEDYRNLHCDRKKFVVEGKRWDSPDGIDDECLADSFIQWVSEDIELPFFAIMWPYQTHYPYFVANEKIDFGVSSDKFNRYLNAVHHIDKTLGRLLWWLEEKKLLETTLVCIVGDHGEAFGHHKQFGHASNIYEENIHVPLILINPVLFKGEEYSTIGGLIDISPTALDILNLPLPANWQGRSLFDTQRNGRVYFFSPWSDFLFGYRENNLKLIFNATINKYEIYDLHEDPLENENLADQLPEIRDEGAKRLAAWVQFQNKIFMDLFRKQLK